MLRHLVSDVLATEESMSVMTSNRSMRVSDLVFDRFMRGKGSEESECFGSFECQRNQGRREIALRYWIYFQGGVNLKAGAAKDSPVCFQDPTMEIAAAGA